MAAVYGWEREKSCGLACPHIDWHRVILENNCYVRHIPLAYVFLGSLQVSFLQKTYSNNWT